MHAETAEATLTNEHTYTQIHTHIHTHAHAQTQTHAYTNAHIHIQSTHIDAHKHSFSLVPLAHTHCLNTYEEWRREDTRRSEDTRRKVLFFSFDCGVLEVPWQSGKAAVDHAVCDGDGREISYYQTQRLLGERLDQEGKGDGEREER